jgi:hypothetical protein
VEAGGGTIAREGSREGPQWRQRAREGCDARVNKARWKMGIDGIWRSGLWGNWDFRVSLDNDVWGQLDIPGLRVRGYGFGTPIPASARPDGFCFHPISIPTGFFFTKPAPFGAGIHRVIGFRGPIATRNQSSSLFPLFQLLTILGLLRCYMG